MNKAMRIGVFAGGRDLDPTQNELINIARWLSKRGHEIVVFALKGTDVLHLANEKSLSVVKLSDHRANYDFNVALRLRRALKKAKINLLIFRDYNEAGLLVAGKFLSKGKLRLVYLQDRPLGDMKIDFLHTFRFNQIDAWISPLTALANEVRSGTNLERKKLHVIQFPIKLKALIKTGLSKIQAREELELPQNGIILGCHLSGNANDLPAELCDLLHVLDSFKGLKKLYLLLSISPLSQIPISKVEGKIAELGLEQMVKPVSLDRDHPSFYKACSAVFLLPETEPFAGIATRALASGLPCISTNTLSTSELLNNGEFGLLYNRGSREQLGKELRKIIENPDYLKQYSDVVSDIVRHETGIDTFCRNIENLIAGLPKRSEIK